METLKTLTAAAALSLAALAPLAARADGVQVLNEDFADMKSLSGWAELNNSDPLGEGWFQGNTGIFTAQAGNADSYAAANFFGTKIGLGSVDNWLITPTLTLSGATTLTFFTRNSDPGYADHLEVLFSPGSGTNTSSFTSLLSVGPDGYPNDWTQYIANLNYNGTGRFAFRYVGDADALSYVGLDSVQVVTAVPEPSLSLMLGFGLGALALLRRRRAI